MPLVNGIRRRKCGAHRVCGRVVQALFHASWAIKNATKLANKRTNVPELVSVERLHAVRGVAENHAGDGAWGVEREVSGIELRSRVLINASSPTRIASEQGSMHTTQARAHAPSRRARNRAELGRAGVNDVRTHVLHPIGGQRG